MRYMPAYKVLSSTFSLKGLARKVSALLQQSAVCQLCEFSTHLFSGVPCSCEVCAGVSHCDEHAPWTGSLTSCLNLALPARCHGTCTTWSTLHRCRTRTPRGATHRHASSCYGSRMLFPNSLLWFGYINHPLSLLSTVALHRHSTCDLSYAPLLIWRFMFLHIPQLLFPPFLLWLLSLSPSSLVSTPPPPPPLSSKKLGDVGLGWGQTMIKKKTSFRPHAEHIVRRRGLGGTVLG